MLQRFTRLTHLSLNIRREFDIPPGESKIPFPALQSLVVTAPSKSLKRMVETIDCPRLNHLDLRPKPSCTVLDLQDCLGSCASAFGSTLDSLVIWAWHLSIREIHSEQTYASAAAVLPSLARLPHLQSLKLAASARFWMPGFALEEICGTLPELRALALDLLWEHPSDNNEYWKLEPPKSCLDTLVTLPAPTLETVIKTSRLCPHLRTLELPMLEATSSGSTGVPSHHELEMDVKIETVRVRGGPVGDVARALQRQFGCVEVARWLSLPKQPLPLANVRLLGHGPALDGGDL